MECEVDRNHHHDRRSPFTRETGRNGEIDDNEVSRMTERNAWRSPPADEIRLPQRDLGTHYYKPHGR